MSHASQLQNAIQNILMESKALLVEMERKIFEQLLMKRKSTWTGMYLKARNLKQVYNMK